MHLELFWALKPLLVYALTITITAYIYNRLNNDDLKFTIAVGGGMIGTVLFSMLSSM